MSLHQDIRGALTARANSVGNPLPDLDWRSYEGVPFRPEVGEAYVAYTLLPVSARPATLGQYGLSLHQGLFQIGLFWPTGSGTGSVEAAADAMEAAFTAGDVLTQGSTKVRVRFVERGQIQQQPDWLQLPITVGWDLHTPTQT